MIGRRPRGRSLALVAGAVTALAALCAPQAAVAAAPVVPTADSPSDWWYDGFGVPDVHKAGWTGKGVKIAVIDSQINPDLPVFAGTGLTVDEDPLCEGGHVTSTALDDSVVHGSDVTALLIGNGKGAGHVRGITPDADVTFYAVGFAAGSHEGYACSSPDSENFVGPVARGIERAVDDGARVISISQGVAAKTKADVRVIADALARGVMIVAAVPNSLGSDEGDWPWSYNGVVAVNAFGGDNGELQKDASDSSRLDIWPGTTVVAPGVGFPSVAWGDEPWTVTGSSLATPLTAGILAVTAQKYPDATSDQLIQSLIHNTTPDDHELSRDDQFGYGPVSLRHMLRVDPTGYPDENPLMDKSSGVPIADQVAQVRGDRVASASPRATAGAGAGSAAQRPDVENISTAGVVVPWVIAGVALVVVVVLAVVVIVVFMRKKKTAGGAA